MEFIDENNNKIESTTIEITEQKQAHQYIPPDAVVLELGARYGTVSCIISKKLSNSQNLVVVEPDKIVWDALEKNMKHNGCNFNIVKGAISNKPQNIVIDGYSTRLVNGKSDAVQTYKLDDIEKKYNLKFNTLVADCEGCLESFFNENPIMYEQLQLLIIEEDQGDICNYDKIKENLKNAGFKMIENDLNEVWRSVWKKEQAGGKRKKTKSLKKRKSIKTKKNKNKAIKNLVKGGSLEEDTTSNDFSDYFWNKPKKFSLHKWHHYFEIYDRHFSKYKNKNPIILEIGVQNGGSLEMWNYYFKNNCTIYGIDIDPNCLKMNDVYPNVKVFIGDQSDDNFLNSIKSQIPVIDILIDDGSHINSHIIKTFKALYPNISLGGTYLIEDLHTAYWPEFGGELNGSGSAIEYLKTLIDELNAKHIKTKTVDTSFSNITNSLHFYDSITVIEKNKIPQIKVENSVRS
jgi:FkbM family methyltransferase